MCKAIQDIMDKSRQEGRANLSMRLPMMLASMLRQLRVGFWLATSN